MNLCPSVVLLCSRAVGKSFITALYCCAVCVLYPDSKVVATAKRKKTIELLVKEKIEKELIPKSPNLAREINPDLILLDVMMPIMNGWETLKAIRNNSKTKCF